MTVTKWQCATCSIEVPIATWLPFRCPNATFVDRRHVLQILDDGALVRSSGDDLTFAAYDGHLAWAASAEANGMSSERRLDLIADLDDRVRAVDGVGFAATPLSRSTVMSKALGFDATGGVWVKDETGAVGGSQKARFLCSILLHLLAAEEMGALDARPRLAIASCGNAALAAATLARAVDWPIDVYVPAWMSQGFGDRLDALDAKVHRCERRDDDPPGDPAMLRFREAVADGAIPFTVQGPENALCLDGGRTLGWEVADQLRVGGIDALDGLFVQVGGGAFATAVGEAIISGGLVAPLFAVQTEGCAPLERAWRRARAAGIVDVAAHWGELMTIWDEPNSIADGILDDETYDWVGIDHVLLVTGGEPVVAPETLVVEAHALAQRAGYDVGPTGSAGLAGLLAIRDRFAPDGRVLVVMSGVSR